MVKKLCLHVGLALAVCLLCIVQHGFNQGTLIASAITLAIGVPITLYLDAIS